MHPALVALTVVAPNVLALPKKTLVVGQHLANARKATMNSVNRAVKSMMRKGVLEDEVGRDLLNKIKLLRNSADGGWSSKEELAALRDVSWHVSKSYAEEVGWPELKRQANAAGVVLSDAAKFAQKQASRAASRATEFANNIRDRFN